MPADPDKLGYKSQPSSAIYPVSAHSHQLPFEPLHSSHSSLDSPEQPRQRAAQSLTNLPGEFGESAQKHDQAMQAAELHRGATSDYASQLSAERPEPSANKELSNEGKLCQSWRHFAQSTLEKRPPHDLPCWPDQDVIVAPQASLNPPRAGLKRRRRSPEKSPSRNGEREQSKSDWETTTEPSDTSSMLITGTLQLLRAVGDNRRYWSHVDHVQAWIDQPKDMRSQAGFRNSSQLSPLSNVMREDRGGNDVSRSTEDVSSPWTQTPTGAAQFVDDHEPARLVAHSSGDDKQAADRCKALEDARKWTPALDLVAIHQEEPLWTGLPSPQLVAAPSLPGEDGCLVGGQAQRAHETSKCEGHRSRKKRKVLSRGSSGV